MTGEDDMGFFDTSHKSYVLEEWYGEQTEKWDALTERGWEFRRPQFVPGTVGIHMKRGADSAEFRVEAELSRELINTRLLRLCETYDFEVSR